MERWIDDFRRWLEARGCEILPVSNPFEVLRFRGAQVGIIYSTGRTNSRYTDRAIAAFRNKSRKWDGAPIRVGRHPGYRKEKAQLIARDGTRCFYCGRELGDDITVEHLIALSCGGSNTLSNMVLAHEACNQRVHNMPVFRKVETAIRYRINSQHPDYEK